MARGRFLSKEISVDKKVNDLKNPWSMLAFTWLLAHADAEGRTYGDPAIVKSLVFPRQGDSVSTKDMEGFIQDWHNAGLVIWYEFDGDRFIEFPNFDKHQAGLRKDREPKSIIPVNIDNDSRKIAGSSPEDCQQNAGSLQDEVKLSKVKLSKVEGEVEVEVGVGDNDPSLSAEFLSISGLKSPTSEYELKEWTDNLSRMKSEGVTAAIMRRACQELTEKKYRITSPKSIVKACEMIIAEGRRDNKRVDNSEFAQFINR